VTCSDGSSTKRETPTGETAQALKQEKPPVGALRAWKTPSLTRRQITILGERTVEYLDRKGQRWDLHRFVEPRDGTLVGYQDGVGLDDDKEPWLRGRPWKLD